LASVFEVNVCSRSSIWLFLLSIFIRTAQAAPAAGKIPDVRQIARSSALIFSGKVFSVDRQPGNSVSPATTLIQLQVLEAIRGVRRGQVIQIREWGGLWDAGERYHKGEQVLLFLYPPGKAGLTSPVGGRGGRFQNGRRWSRTAERKRQSTITYCAGKKLHHRNQPEHKGLVCEEEPIFYGHGLRY
jgi:hypothetical protein